MRPIILAFSLFTLLFSSQEVGAQPMVERSFQRLVSSNGHVVVSYDRERSRVDTLLEHPYRFRTPRNMPENLCYAADESRDLAYDTYFGVRAGSEGQWFGELPLHDAAYIEGTGIIRAEQYAGADRGLAVTSHIFSPMEIAAPVVIMTATVENRGAEPVEVSLYALFNFRIGDAAGEREPSPEAEEAIWDETRGVFYEYSDRSQGTLAYVPLRAAARRTVSGGDSGVYSALLAGADLDGNARTSGPSRDVAPGLQWETVRLAPGESTSEAVAIVWAGDEDAAPTVDRVREWAGTDSAPALVERETAGWEAWHVDPPASLADEQRRLWRQSAAILRMGQVREAGRGYGQILASMPPGLGNIEAQWNISWVRDMAYAVVGLIRAGHLEEARAAIEFQLGAGPGRRTDEVGQPYRISATRYFGDGQEETDCNDNGPNVEFDGFGLFLWTVGEYMRAGGEMSDLMEWWPVIRDEVAAVLTDLIDENGLIKADSSIWEVHWNGQQRKFAYTSLAAVRGLCDAAAMAEGLGDMESARRFAEAGAQVRDAVGEHLVDENGVIAQSEEDLASGGGYLDAATVEAINWGVIHPEGRIARQTVDALLENLTVATGYGLMRNDDGGWYDSQEWVFVDFRLLPALRMQARETRADALLGWLEAQALTNDLQFSELHEAERGTYAGSIPMVGFGAGAYILALTDTSIPAAACGEFLAEEMSPLPGEPGDPDGGGMTGPLPGPGPASGDEGCGCLVISSPDEGAPWGLALLLLGLVAYRRLGR